VSKAKMPEEKNLKFDEYLKWIKKTHDLLEHDLRLVGHFQDMVSWKKQSEYLKDKRVCIDRGKVFVASLDEIEKNKFQLIEDVPISQWGLDIEHSDLDKHRKGIIETLKILSTFNLYVAKKGDFLDLDPFRQKIYNDLYKHDDY
jgi:hypothetical protein